MRLLSGKHTLMSTSLCDAMRLEGLWGLYYSVITAVSRRNLCFVASTKIHMVIGLQKSVTFNIIGS